MSQTRIKQIDIAKRFGVTEQTVSKWARIKGMDVSTMEEAEEWHAANIENARGGEAADTLQSARLEVILLDAEKRKIQIARMRGEQVSFEVVKQTWTEMLLRVKSYIENARGITREQAAEITKEINAEISTAAEQIKAAIFARKGEEAGEEPDDEE